MIELEKTYLAKKLPDNLEKLEHREIVDIYIPRESKHPSLRLRKKGDKYRLTKKEPVKEGDSSEMKEQTIVLTELEFKALEKQIEGKRVGKTRYNYNYQGNIAEIDVFDEALKGLVLVDFEFKTVEAKNQFEIPEFCLAEVTQEKFTAGGMLCGKKYSDIEEELSEFEYAKLYFF